MWYNTTGELAENVIATWDNGSMPDVYVTQDNGVVVSSGNYAGTHTGGEPDQAYGLFTSDRNDETMIADARVLGSIGYLRGKHRYDPSTLFYLWSRDQIRVENSVAYAEAGNYDGKTPFMLAGPTDSAQGIGLFASHLSSIAADADQITSEWSQTDVEHATSPSELGDSVYIGAGAHLCYEYVDGVETTTPLWPWRMNARIVAATTQAAKSDHQHWIYQGDPPALTQVNDPHAIEDVTGAVEAMFGPIPSQCRR
jgi:hypothetical protein